MKVKTRSHVIVSERRGLTALHSLQSWDWSGVPASVVPRSEARVNRTPMINNAMGIFLMYEYSISCSNTKITWSVMFKSILKGWDQGDILVDSFLCSVSLHNHRSGLDDSSLPLVALKILTVSSFYSMLTGLPFWRRRIFFLELICLLVQFLAYWTHLAS